MAKGKYCLTISFTICLSNLLDFEILIGLDTNSVNRDCCLDGFLSIAGSAKEVPGSDKLLPPVISDMVEVDSD